MTHSSLDKPCQLSARRRNTGMIMRLSSVLITAGVLSVAIWRAGSCQIDPSAVEGAAGVALGEVEPTGADELWRDNYHSALADAAEEHKLVLLRFTASWCMPCRVMDANVWPDAEVRRTLAGRFIPVKNDVEIRSNQQVAQRYGVRGIPTLILVDQHGKDLAHRQITPQRTRNCAVMTGIVGG